MRRLKVLFIAAWYPTKESPVGGIFVREHAKAAALYNDITVLYAQASNSPQRNRYEISDSVEDGIRTIRATYCESRIPKTSTLFYVWHVFRAFRRLVKDGWRPDIIHAHIYLAGVAGVFLGRIYKIPVIITEHYSGFPRHLLGRRAVIEAKFAMNGADYILPVSDALRKGIWSYGIKNRFQIVPNVVDTNLFHPSSKLKKDTYVKRILLVALLNPVKGVPYLLEALNKLKRKRDDFFLDIVGDGPNRTEYEELAVRLGISDKVCFHGVKTKEQVAEFMQSSDFFVLPSLWENLPCVLIEAAASGLPIIATEVGGIPEIVNKNVGIMVPSKDPNALVNSIDYMLDHTQDYSPELISLYARQWFSYEMVGKRLDSIYKEIDYEKANR